MFHSVFSRLLTVATVLTLLVFSASAGLQPAPAFASPEVGPDLVGVVSYLDDDDNGNNGNNDDNDDNGNQEEENENNGDDDNGNAANAGGGGFFNPCVFPWFATNPACTFGLFGG
jgi:hypothetical protein